MRKVWYVMVVTLGFGLLAAFAQPIVTSPLPAEILTMTVQEVIRLSPEGDAEIVRIVNVPPSPLADLYAQYWKAYAEQEEVRRQFSAELEKEYQIMLGIKPPPELMRIKPPPEMALLAAAPMEIQVTAKIPGLVRYDPKQKVYSVLVGPQTKEIQDWAVHNRLTSFIFQSMYLESLPKEQVLKQHKETRFELPKDAKILNRDELLRLKWRTDLGGGTVLTGFIKVEENAVVFMEELNLAEKPPTILVEVPLPTMEALAKHGIFGIQYSLPEVKPLPVPPPTGFAPPTNWSGSWSYSYSRTISATISFPNGSVTPSATPSIYFGAYLGWEFKSWWEGGGLKWFQAYIDVNPSLTASLNASITRAVSATKSITVWSYDQTFWFWVDYIPVWITLSIEASAQASVSAQAKVDFRASGSAGATNRLGARWEGGWRMIRSYSSWASSPSFSVSAGAKTTLTAGPELSFAAYVYSVAGPFVALTPYLKAEITVNPNRWALKAGFTASGGVELAGWLKSFLGGIPSYSVDFYTWEKEIGSGSW
jgi:hypothetical protein